MLGLHCCRCKDLSWKSGDALRHSITVSPVRKVLQRIDNICVTWMTDQYDQCIFCAGLGPDQCKSHQKACRQCIGWKYRMRMAENTLLVVGCPIHFIRFHVTHWQYLLESVSLWSLLEFRQQPGVCIYAGIWDIPVPTTFLVFILRSCPATNRRCLSACFFNFDWPRAVNDNRNRLCRYTFR